jgi:aminoacyl-tRNA hydrolase
MIRRLERIAVGAWKTVAWRLTDRGRHLAACANRRRLRGTTFIGITGSAGKTTTKDLVVAILSARGKVASVAGSPNDNDALDRLVLRVRASDRYCVAEVGAYRPGCLDRSVRTVKPTVGVLTVIAQEHYGAFRTLEAVASEKRKLIDCLPADGCAVLNIDDPRVRKIGENCRAKVVWIGQDPAATVRLIETRSAWPEPLTLEIECHGERHLVRTRLHGVHLAVPALAALGVAVGMGVPIQEAIAAVGTVDPVEGRMQVVSQDDGVVFIRDDCKAPDWSYHAPLEYLGASTAQRKIAVIGTISDSKREDRRRYAKAAKLALGVADLVILVGGKNLSTARAREICDDDRLKLFRNVRDCAEYLKNELRAGDLVLLKGTNKQDHLVRIMLHRTRDVQCWTMICGRQGFCGTGCNRVYAGPPEGLDQVSVSTEWGEVPAGPRVPVVVGIGNPGDQYADTPHNVGHALLDSLVADAGVNWEDCPEGWTAVVETGGVESRLFKANAYVNLTGQAVARLLARIDAHPADCVIVHDDLAIPLGDARHKRDGGDAGHKGMKSVTAELGTDEIHRIRIGVQHSSQAGQSTKVVLARFGEAERQALAPGMRKAESLLARLVVDVAKGGADSPAQALSPPSRVESVA